MFSRMLVQHRATCYKVPEGIYNEICSYLLSELFMFAVANQSNHVSGGKDSHGSVSHLRQTANQQHVGITDAAFRDSLRRTASCAPSSLPQRYTIFPVFEVFI
jgi:hypothetical protein